MASFACQEFCKEGDMVMSKKLTQITTSVVAGNRPAPVRVRLRRINCNYAQPYPPDGQAFEWWAEIEKRLRYGLERIRGCLAATGNRSRSVTNRWDFRDCRERYVGIHRERPAQGRSRKRTRDPNGMHSCRSYGCSWEAWRRLRHRSKCRCESLRSEPAAARLRSPTRSTAAPKDRRPPVR